MIFLSYWFVIFALVFFPVYWALRHPRARLTWLLIACVIFHGHFAGAAGVIPIVVIGVLTYLIGLTRNPKLCVAGIVLCAASLAYYKYTNFIVAQLSAWTHGWIPADLKLQPAAPLAISFFAFEFIHYLFDIRRGSPALRNPIHFIIFAIFWPTIVAGPVKRYESFVPALCDGSLTAGRQDLAQGFVRLAIGIVKKLLADNYLSGYVAWAVPIFDSLPMWQRWYVFALIGLRILMDFSGYSDMAIGMARMMGIVVPENFWFPYLSVNLTEFWRRWHISLSSWIRDYVYIPLGGSRHGPGRKLLNGLIAFAICGLWHGAAWNFVFWGVYHGIGLGIVNVYRRNRIGEKFGVLMTAAPPLAWGVTMAYVFVGWLFFFYPMGQAWKLLTLLLSNPT